MTPRGPTVLAGKGAGPGVAPSADGPQKQERLLNRAGARDGATLLVEQVLRLSLVTVMAMWIARELGPASFGVLNYASAVVAVLYAVSTLGLDNPVMVRLSREERTPGVLFGSAMMLRLLAGAVCVPIALGVVVWMRPQDEEVRWLVLIVALTLPLYAPCLLDAWFKHRQLALPAALSRLWATLASSAAKAACLLLGAGVAALAWTIVLEAVIASLGLWVAHRMLTRETVVERLRVQGRMMGELLRGCLPHAAAALTIVAYLKVDVVMLGMLSTHAETGLYSLSQKFCEVLYILPVVVADVLYPRLARHVDVRQGAAQADSQTFFDLTMAAAIAGTLAAVACAGWLIPVVFGEAYRRSAEVFQLHAFTCLGVAMAHARMKWLVAAGWERAGLVLTAFGLALAVLLHAILIPRAGAIGAATASVLSHVVSGYLASWVMPSLRDVAAMQTRALWPWVRLARALQPKAGVPR